VITAPPPAQPSPSPAPVTKQQAVAAINSLIDEGMSQGAIRDDAGLDLKQMVRNATEVSQLDSVRVKIDDRERDSSVTPELAAKLRSAVDTLATAMEP
jgi:serine/threonine-protein kinase